MKSKTSIAKYQLICWLGISESKYYQWQKRLGEPNKHNGHIVRAHWVLPWEREAIIQYCRTNMQEGYRRLTYMMIDDNVVCVSPSTTYRVLKDAGLLNRWNTKKSKTKKLGFDQPGKPNQPAAAGHMDIKYVNFKGTFLFFIGVIDGYSRYIVHHELRHFMNAYDVELTLQRAIEKFPGERPNIISDNGPQFISKDFTEFLRIHSLQQVRTSVAYPQSNGKMEVYMRTLNQECLIRSSFINFQDAQKQIARFVEYYNNVRLHSSLGYLTPKEYLDGNVKERYKERQRKLDQARERRKKERAAA